MADIVFTGNVGSVEMKFLPSGKAVLNLRVAEGHRKRDGNAWVDDGTTWHNVTAWERQAETLAEVLNKGDRVVVTGTLRSREYEKDGSKRTAWDVTARQVGVVPKAGAPAGGATQPAGGAVDDPWGTGTPPF